MSSFLIVFDFDHTILDSNSDENVPRHLGTLELLKERYHQGMQWTCIISECVEMFSEDEVRSAVRATANVHRGTIDAFELISSLPRDMVSVCIASDANTLFIDETMRHVLPQVKVDAVHTNAFISFSEPRSDGRKCRIDKYEPAGHGCVLCKHSPQMCKGKIVRLLLESTRLTDPIIIYVGDGENDYCPIASVLRPRDVCLYRQGFGLEKKLRRDEAAVCCRLVGWSDGDGLHSAFRQLLKPTSNATTGIPRIVSFGEGIADSFRGVTLRTRLPQLIDRVVLANTAQLTPAAKEQLLALAGDLSANRAVRPLPGDAVVPKWILNYSSSLSSGEGSSESNHPPCWGQVPWLQGEIYFNLLVLALSECRDAMHDIYTSEKEEALVSFLDTLVLPIVVDDPTANPFHWSREDALPLLIRNMLWGNSVDLSMFDLAQLRQNNTATTTTTGRAELERIVTAAEAHAVALFGKDVLVVGNQLGEIDATVRRLLQKTEKGKDREMGCVDIVMDNAGVECCADILFGAWVATQSNRALRVRFHVKAKPFYVSDTNLHDVEFLLATLAASSAGASFVVLVRSFIADGTFVFAPNAFWTEPCEMREMPPSLVTSHFYCRNLNSPSAGPAPPAEATVHPKSRLVVFKGDLNFRRLVGDRDWDNGISFATARSHERTELGVVESLDDVLADFWPTDDVPVVALRTAKSEVSVGVPKAAVAQLDATVKNWRVSGKYAVALLSPKTRRDA